MFTETGENEKFSDVRTPRVPKNPHEKSDVSEPKRRFKAIAAIKQFARVFSIMKANKRHNPTDTIEERIIPINTDPVKEVNAKVKNPQKEMSPSIKSARVPVYSLNNAPVAARRSGHEKPKKLIMLFSSYCNHK